MKIKSSTYKQIDVMGDGNCFYYSFILALCEAALQPGFSPKGDVSIFADVLNPYLKPGEKMTWVTFKTFVQDQIGQTKYDKHIPFKVMLKLAPRIRNLAFDLRNNNEPVYHNLQQHDRLLAPENYYKYKFDQKKNFIFAGTEELRFLVNYFNIKVISHSSHEAHGKTITHNETYKPAYIIKREDMKNCSDDLLDTFTQASPTPYLNRIEDTDCYEIESKVVETAIWSDLDSFEVHEDLKQRLKYIIDNENAIPVVRLKYLAAKVHWNFLQNRSKSLLGNLEDCTFNPDKVMGVTKSGDFFEVSLLFTSLQKPSPKKVQKKKNPIQHKLKPRLPTLSSVAYFMIVYGSVLAVALGYTALGIAGAVGAGVACVILLSLSLAVYRDYLNRGRTVTTPDTEAGRVSTTHGQLNKTLVGTPSQGNTNQDPAQQTQQGETPVPPKGSLPQSDIQSGKVLVKV